MNNQKLNYNLIRYNTYDLIKDKYQLKLYYLNLFRSYNDSGIMYVTDWFTALNKDQLYKIGLVCEIQMSQRNIRITNSGLYVISISFCDILIIRSILNDINGNMKVFTIPIYETNL